MRVDAIFEAAREPVFSFEFFPPKTGDGEASLAQAVERLAALDPDFVSVTWGAGGSTATKTVDWVHSIRERHGLEAVPHCTLVGLTVDELQGELARMRDGGIENLLALRGDPPGGEGEFRPVEGGLSHASDLARLASADHDFCVLGACYPEGHVEAEDLKTDLEHLVEKVAAGTRVLITQLFFDNADYFRFVDAARAAGVDVPIVPGILPIRDAGQVRRFAAMCGARIPEALDAAMNEAEAAGPTALEELGVAYATGQCAELLAAGAPGIHFYTLNRADPTAAVVSALRAQRPWAGSPGRMAARG